MVVLGYLLAVAAMLWFLAGLAAMWQPRFVGLSKRRHAVAFWAFSIVILGFGVDLAPTEPGAEPAGFPMLVLWIAAVLLGFGVTRIIRLQREAAKQSPTPIVKDEPAVREQSANIAPLARIAPTARPSPTPRPAQRASLRKAPERQWQVDDYGEQASFTYVDADGVITDRTIFNWRSEGPYIRGICVQRRQSRTFRKDRIEDWSAI